jgi:hypothetical protein
MDLRIFVELASAQDVAHAPIGDCRTASMQIRGRSSKERCGVLIHPKRGLKVHALLWNYAAPPVDCPAEAIRSESR